MNRIYNEWYRSKGYNFDITSSPMYDQTYTLNRSTYENINDIVNDIFNNYVIKNNQVQPYFTQYCDGRTTICNGLSQWGTVTLANQGKTPLQILQNYGKYTDIEYYNLMNELEAKLTGTDITKDTIEDYAADVIALYFDTENTPK